MFKKLPLMFFLLIHVWSQTATNVQYEILTESLTIGEEPYIAQIELQVQSPQEIDFITMDFDSLTTPIHLVTAELNGELLWLLRSEEKAANDQVLTWRYNTEETRLRIYPGNWPVPYRLILAVQIVMTQKEPIADILHLSVQMNNSMSPCQTVGRGNVIRFIR
jgi:hypothetical protein